MRWVLRANRLHCISGAQKFGLVQAGDVPALRALYAVNPLLCDFVVKRLMRSPAGNRFDVGVFTRFHDMIGGTTAAPVAAAAGGASAVTATTAPPVAGDAGAAAVI